MRSAVAALALIAACSAEPGQHEITAPGELLTAAGRLREPGWARRELLHWDPARVHDPAQLRQWDFFTVLDSHAAVNLTLLDLGILKLGTVGVVDFDRAESFQTVVAGDLVLTPALEGTAALTVGGADALRFVTGDDASALGVSIAAPLFGPPAQATLTVHRRPSMPYLSLATPFLEDPYQFFFEQKVPGMTAEGTVTVGDRTFSFAGANAVMDWGRGQWPSTVTWRWAAASGTVDGINVAFNLGEGFGDARAATENLVVYDDVPTKLGEVEWTFDATDPMHDWSFASRDGRFALVLRPIAPEVSALDLGAKFQHVRKAYGRFSGTIVAGGRTVSVDGLLGFAEEVDLAW